ncbi:MAG: 5-formyltetrahydrofolate cyclo-ligase [Promethearchaeota archaeon]
MVTQFNPTQLRKEILSKRKNISTKKRSDAFSSILRTFFELPEYQNAKSIIAYFGKVQSGEFDTRGLLLKILKDGKNLYLPRCREGEIALDIYQISDISVDVEEGAYGIMEPKSFCKKQENDSSDLILVPGSVFDIRGARYGYGAGYYDKFLENRTIFKIAFALEMAVMKTPIPTHPHDIFMDVIITEKNIYRKS